MSCIPPVEIMTPAIAFRAGTIMEKMISIFITPPQVCKSEQGLPLQAIPGLE
jgi:hypothetical protein